MLNFNRRTKIFVSKEPADMRASYDTLFSKARGVLRAYPKTPAALKAMTADTRWRQAS